MRTVPLKAVADVAFSSIDKKSIDGQVPVRLCNYTDVYYNERIVANMPFMEATATPDQVARFSLRRGDVLLTKDSETAEDIGVSAVVSEDMPGVLCGYHLAVARPKPGTDGRFLRWALASSSARGQLEVAATGVTRFGLRQDAVAGMLVPSSGAAWQRAIADYLDAETARIDALIGMRRRQLTLANESLMARIWAATTKGLDPGAVRPSRLDWVGEIPAHWGTPTIGSNFDVQLGKMLSPDASSAGEQSPYLRNVNVQWDRIDTSDLNTMHFDAADRLRYALRPGDLLVCEGGEVGRSALWGGEVDECFYQKALHRLRPLHSASARFLMYVLWAASSRGVFDNEGNASTIVHLTAEKLRAHRVPWPPPREQHALAAELDKERAHLGAITAAIEAQIDLLLERRQSLITAAVTGEIEIPGVAA